jgi:hypothetical protein
LRVEPRQTRRVNGGLERSKMLFAEGERTETGCWESHCRKDVATRYVSEEERQRDEWQSETGLVECSKQRSAQTQK